MVWPCWGRLVTGDRLCAISTLLSLLCPCISASVLRLAAVVHAMTESSPSATTSPDQLYLREVVSDTVFYHSNRKGTNKIPDSPQGVTVGFLSPGASLSLCV